MFYAFVILAVIAILFGPAAIEWLKKSKSPATQGEAGPTVMTGFPGSDGSTQFAEVTFVKPCDANTHACKYVAPLVSVTEPCQMTATEDAIKTVKKNTTRMKKMLVDARQALLDFTTDEPSKPAEAAA